MTRRGLTIASLLLVMAMLGVALSVGGGLPDDARLPIHWNVRGEADGFGDKWTALLTPVGIAALLSLLFYFLPSLEPRRKGLERSQRLYLWGWAALLLMSGAIELVVVSEALGWALPANHIIIAATGMMLLLIGNQLGKSRSMYMVGIRTPWTLASEEVWIKTHRLGGKLMVIGGGLMVVASLLPLPSSMLAAVAGASLAITVGVPVVYSYFRWRKEKTAQPSANCSTSE